MRRPLAIALVAMVAGAALAQEGADLAPESAPAPVARPEGLGAESGPAPEEAPEAEEVPEGNAAAEEPAGEEPTPPEGEDRPALIPPEEMAREAAEEPQAEEPGEGPAEEEPAGPPQPEVLAETPEELAACLAALDALGVGYERAEPVSEQGNPDCGMANPVTVTALAPGVALEPPSTMRCATALAGAAWVADVVLPLSRKLEGRGEVVAIDQGTAYLCRPRADGEMSEHAFGNALDVMGFRFAAGEPIVVQPRAGDGTLDEAFQRAVRAGACLDFATVLGPGSDADHADHLHFDVKAREGGFRICE